MPDILIKGYRAYKSADGFYECGIGCINGLILGERARRNGRSPRAVEIAEHARQKDVLRIGRVERVESGNTGRIVQDLRAQGDASSPPAPRADFSLFHLELVETGLFPRLLDCLPFGQHCGQLGRGIVGFAHFVLSYLVARIPRPFVRGFSFPRTTNLIPVSGSLRIVGTPAIFTLRNVSAPYWLYATSVPSKILDE